MSYPAILTTYIGPDTDSTFLREGSPVRPENWCEHWAKPL